MIIQCYKLMIQLYNETMIKLYNRTMIQMMVWVDTLLQTKHAK